MARAPADQGKVAVELIEHAAENAGEIVIADGVPDLGPDSPFFRHIVSRASAGLETKSTVALAFESRGTTRMCNQLFVSVEKESSPNNCVWRPPLLDGYTDVHAEIKIVQAGPVS